MIINKAPYPINLNTLLEKSRKIAETLKERLNHSECPVLDNLFFIKNNKRHINTDIFGSVVKNEGSSHLYIFGEVEDGTVVPVYVGITRNIRQRLRNHGWGKTHSSATLVYLIADKKHRNSFELKGADTLFNKVQISGHIGRNFIDNNSDVPKARIEVQNFKVVTFEIENDYELYFHEAAIAGILKTTWNCFKTH